MIYVGLKGGEGYYLQFWGKQSFIKLLLNMYKCKMICSKQSGCNKTTQTFLMLRWAHLRSSISQSFVIC